MERSLFILISAVFLAVVLAGLGVRSLALARSARKIKDRLSSMTRGESLGLDSSFLRDGKLSSLPPLNRMLERFRFTRRLESLLIQADVSLSVGTLTLLMLTLASLGAFLCVSAFSRPVLALPAALALGIAPLLVLFRKKSIRRLKFERQLPDALDLITSALRSGMAFVGAVQLVAEESPDPMSKEFTIVFEEQRLGLDLGESLNKLTTRVDSREIRLFVTAVLLQRETGGNLAEVLEGAADVIRDRFRIFGDIRTITAHARLTGTVLAILPPGMAMIIWWMQPGYLKALLQDPVGPLLIVTAVVLQIVGYFVIRRIIAIKV